MSRPATEYIHRPIGSAAGARDASDMEAMNSSLAELRAAAARLGAAAAETDPVAARPMIEQLEVVLRELSVTCYTLGTESDGAADDQRRTALAVLHSVAGAVATAARVCRTEGRALAARAAARS